MKKTRTKKKQSVSTTPPASAGEPTREEIAAAAHALWEQEGRPEGHELEHWFKAEHQLRQGRARGPAPTESTTNPSA